MTTQPEYSNTGADGNPTDDLVFALVKADGTLVPLLECEPGESLENFFERLQRHVRRQGDARLILGRLLEGGAKIEPRCALPPQESYRAAFDEFVEEALRQENADCAAPTPEDLEAELASGFMRSALEEAQQRINAIYLANGTLTDCADCAAGEYEPYIMASAVIDGICLSPSLSALDLFIAATLLKQCADEHSADCEAAQKARIAAVKQNPATPIVKAWLKKPVSVAPDTKHTGILPKVFHYVAKTDAQQRLFNLPGPAPQQARLPVFNDIPASHSALWLWDAMGNDVHGRKSSSASYELRLFVEMLLAVPQTHRSMAGNIGFRWGDIVNYVFSPRTYYQKRFPAFRRAFDIVDSAYIRYDGDDWFPVKFRRLPGPGSWNAYDKIFLCEYAMPPGSEQGALVHRPTLREVGRSNGVAYALLLSLYVQWDKHNFKGRFAQVQRPRLLRNSDGLLLDKNLEPVLQNGQPLRRWMVTRKDGSRALHSRLIALDAYGEQTDLAHAAYEYNPEADRYDSFEDVGLIALAYPNSDMPNIDRRTKASWKARVIKALTELHDAGHLILDTDNLYYWKPMPPQGWGPGYER